MGHIDYEITDNSIINEIGDRLRARRKQLKLTQVELAENVGLGRKAIMDAENGKGITLNSFIKIMRGLKWLDNLNACTPLIGKAPIDKISKPTQSLLNNLKKTLPTSPINELNKHLIDIKKVLPTSPLDELKKHQQITLPTSPVDDLKKHLHDITNILPRIDR